MRKGAYRAVRWCKGCRGCKGAAKGLQRGCKGAVVSAARAPVPVALPALIPLPVAGSMPLVFGSRLYLQCSGVRTMVRVRFGSGC